MSLRGKRVLITAGPTWVPIDTVRVVSNIATGRTGILLAEKLERLGAKVTLMLGPAQICCLNGRMKVMRFSFFDELKRMIAKELASRKYDIVIQTAAVSDYRPRAAFKKKIRSGIKELTLKLVPTAKIIDIIKKIDRDIYLVGFKFEPEATKKILIAKARGLMARAKLDLTVANTVNKNRYEAYIVSPQGIRGPLNKRNELAEKLVQTLAEGFNY